MDLNQRIFQHRLSAMALPGTDERRRAAAYDRYATLIDEYQQREAIADALEQQRVERAQHGVDSPNDKAFPQ